MKKTILFIKKLWRRFFPKENQLVVFENGASLPLIRKVLSNLVSNDLVSVMPIGAISQPENVFSRHIITEKTGKGFNSQWEFQLGRVSSLLFYLDYKYDSQLEKQLLFEKTESPDIICGGGVNYFNI